MSLVLQKVHRVAEADGPYLRPIKHGWAASGNGWAVHGQTQEEAVRRFHEAVREHAAIAARPYWYVALQSLMRGEG